MKDYKEYIYDLCNSVDWDDKDDIISVMVTLGKEAIRHNALAMRFDEELQKRMLAKDYLEMTTELAKEDFKYNVESMPEGEIRDFMMEHLTEIFNGEFEGEEE